MACEWSNEIAMLFIETYQTEPILWDPKHPQHKDSKKVNDAWLRISEIMNVPVKELKHKKNSLMATFRGHLRRKKASIQSGAASDSIYKPVWFLYNEMESFLGNVNDCLATLNTEHIRDTPIVQGTEEDIDDPDDVTQTSEARSHQTPRHTSRRRAHPPELEQAEKRMKEAFTSLNHAISKHREDDEYDLFGKMIAKKLRKLPEHKREFTMYKIHGMFLQDDMQNSPSPSTSFSRPESISSFSPPLSYVQLPSPSRNFQTYPVSFLQSYSEPSHTPQNIPSRPPSTITCYSEPGMEPIHVVHRPQTHKIQSKFCTTTAYCEFPYMHN